MLPTLSVLEFIKSLVPSIYFVNDFPAKSADASAVVRMSGGSPPSEWSNVVHPGIQVVVRGVKNEDGAAEDLALSILQQLHNRNEFAIAGRRIVHCASEQSAPFYLGTDESGRPLFSINFELTMQM